MQTITTRTLKYVSKISLTKNAVSFKAPTGTHVSKFMLSKKFSTMRQGAANPVSNLSHTSMNSNFGGPLSPTGVTYVNRNQSTVPVKETKAKFASSNHPVATDECPTCKNSREDSYDSLASISSGVNGFMTCTNSIYAWANICHGNFVNFTGVGNDVYAINPSTANVDKFDRSTETWSYFGVNASAIGCSKTEFYSISTDSLTIRDGTNTPILTISSGPYAVSLINGGDVIYYVDSTNVIHKYNGTPGSWTTLPTNPGTIMTQYCASGSTLAGIDSTTGHVYACGASSWYCVTCPGAGGFTNIAGGVNGTIIMTAYASGNYYCYVFDPVAGTVSGVNGANNPAAYSPVYFSTPTGFFGMPTVAHTGAPLGSVYVLDQPSTVWKKLAQSTPIPTQFTSGGFYLYNSSGPGASSPLASSNTGCYMFLAA